MLWTLNAIQIQCGDCSKPSWTDHQDRDEGKPPEGTVAVVVDVRNNIAAIRVFETDKYLGGVGMEDKGKFVVVPWQSTWTYFCTGSPRVGYIVEKE